MNMKMISILVKNPKIRALIKLAYKRIRYMLSKKIKYTGDIIKLTPNDEYEYFFGYYDKSPWDKSGRYVLCLRVPCSYKEVAPTQDGQIVLIDTSDNSFEVIESTKTWNVQQGCMLQWLGPDYTDNIIYNDFINNHFCSVILNVHSREKRVLNFPVYSVDANGKFALSLDFARLHSFRPGYGYSNTIDLSKEQLLPDGACIYYVDLISGNYYSILNYHDIYNFEHRECMKGAVHKVNHIMISPNGTKFMFLHRWIKKNRKWTRLLTCNIDGTELFNLSDENMVSHCFWKNDDYIFAFERKKEGDGYYLMRDKSKEYLKFWDINQDGHPSYSHSGYYVVFDSYPDNSRLSYLKIADTEDKIGTSIKCLAQVFSPFRYSGDVRCDLHPRWSMDDRKICFDAVFEGKRALYYVESGIEN